jgi:subfamily B ATP-binding cassette protein MsbA
MTASRVALALLPLLRARPWGVSTVIALGTLSSLAEGVGIGLFIPFLQSFTPAGTSETRNWVIDSLGDLFARVPRDERLLLICALIFLSVLLKAALSYGSTLVSNWLEADVGHRLRAEAFQHLLTLQFRFLETTESGKLLNTVASEIWRTSEAFSKLLYMMVICCTVVIYATLLLALAWKLTLAVLLTMLFMFLLMRAVTQRAYAAGKGMTRLNAVVATRMIETIEGMTVIRAFGQEAAERSRFNQASSGLTKVLVKLHALAEAVHPIYEILAAAVLVAILVSTVQHAGSLPALLVFIFVLYRLQPKVREFDAARVRLVSLGPAVQEVNALLDSRGNCYLRSGTIRSGALKEGLWFDRVSFQYETNGHSALRDVTITIPARKTTALVGPSGGGKSTLIKLILRFYDVNEGEIRVDGAPIQDFDLHSWRGRIGLVSQDIFLFSATVKENIAYGRVGASDDEIVAAAKQAAAHQFIIRLPQGYDTKLGSQGVRLSGGEKQRIALARAIVREPDILILDEATNALDSISEQLIREALIDLGRHRTVIVIAHRFSTVEHADHIIVLDDGTVREQGDLKRLLKLNGLFARLYNLQSDEASAGNGRPGTDGVSHL